MNENKYSYSRLGVQLCELIDDGNYKYYDQIEGKVVLITGGTQGIGLAIAKKLLNNKCKVIITGRSEKKIGSVLKEINNNNLRGLEWDVKQFNEYDKKFQQAKSYFGNIDVLVNNAGISKIEGKNTSLIRNSQNELRNMMEINAVSSYYMMEKFSKMYSDAKYRTIINIVSNCCQKIPVNIYSISKWAQDTITKAAAQLLISQNIYVCGVAPGPVKTAMSWTEGQSVLKGKIPDGRIAEVDEIANVVAFMIAHSKFMQGKIVTCDGGEVL